MNTTELKKLIAAARAELKKVAEAEFGARRMQGLRGLGAADAALDRAEKKIASAETRTNGEKKAKKAKKPAAAASTK